MSQPSTEARIAAQESLTTLLHAQIKQLSLDTQANFAKLNQDMHLGFAQAHAYIEEHIEERMATKEDLQALETRIKGEMTAMEARIIGAVRDLLQSK